MNFIKKNAYLLLAAIAGLLIISCNNAPTKDKHTIITGRISIVVDESFTPIIEDQLTVFQNTYDNADITLINKPEKLAIDYLLSDSCKIAILARNFTDDENKFFESKSIIPKITKFATDGIALIVHKTHEDSLVKVVDLINLIQGNPSSINSVVFDNPNSSTVRFLKDLAQVKDLPTKNIYALGSNADVIKYVYENPRAIGIIGLNWLTQPSPELVQFIEEIRILKVKNQKGKNGDDGYYEPSQSNLALGKYALARDLYIIDCQGVRGLGLGFSAFLAGERGQRIILKSGLLPDSIPSREINIRNKIN